MLACPFLDCGDCMGEVVTYYGVRKQIDWHDLARRVTQLSSQVAMVEGDIEGLYAEAEGEDKRRLLEAGKILHECASRLWEAQRILRAGVSR